MAVTVSGVSLNGAFLNTFSPQLLFTASNQGMWYDPSDMSTMFQDAAGTTPVTAVEQSVGRILDKSGFGNHATTPAAATTARPVLSARVNLLTKTEQFDDAVWTKTNSTIVQNSITAPDGTLTADTIVENTANGAHFAAQNASLTASLTYRASVYLKSKERSIAYLGLDNGPTGTEYAYVFFNVGTGVIGSNSSLGGWTFSSPSISDVGNGWYRCSLSVTVDSTVTGRIVCGPTTADGTFSYVGNASNGIYIWGADLRLANDGVGLPVYQSVNTATDYNTTDFPMYLRFDGSNDYMLTGTITPGTDKAQVFAGIRKINNSGISTALELSVNSDVNGGAFCLAAPVNAKQYYFQAFGSVSGARIDGSVSSGYPGPITNVLTQILDASGATAADEIKANINASSVTLAYSGASIGSGNFSAYPFYIGSRAGSTFFFNGRFYSIIVRFGPNLTADQILQTETWVNGKTKAY